MARNKHILIVLVFLFFYFIGTLFVQSKNNIESNEKLHLILPFIFKEMVMKNNKHFYNILSLGNLQNIFLNEKSLNENFQNVYCRWIYLEKNSFLRDSVLHINSLANIFKIEYHGASAVSRNSHWGDFNMVLKKISIDTDLLRLNPVLLDLVIISDTNTGALFFGVWLMQNCKSCTMLVTSCDSQMEKKIVTHFGFSSSTLVFLDEYPDISYCVFDNGINN